MRALLRAGSSALLLLAMMVIGSIGLWVGIPLGWLLSLSGSSPLPITSPE